MTSKVNGLDTTDLLLEGSSNRAGDSAGTNEAASSSEATLLDAGCQLAGNRGTKGLGGAAGSHCEGCWRWRWRGDLGIVKVFLEREGKEEGGRKGIKKVCQVVCSMAWFFGGRGKTLRSSGLRRSPTSPNVLTVPSIYLRAGVRACVPTN